MSTTERINWTRDELILCFNLYCKIPFGKMHKGNPEVILLSKIINRSPSSITFKLGNFARLDPELQKRNIKGLSHGSKGEKIIWDEFHHDWDKLVFESELLLAKRKGIKIEKEVLLEEKEFPLGMEREAIIKTRVNQNFFRQSILATYDFKCCITGLNIIELLTASHIVPWSIDKKNRLNPQNGLCLNSIHDRAFDRGFITITPDYKVRLSKQFKEFKENKIVTELFMNFNEKKIILPQKFLPSKEFLEYHYEEIFHK